MASWDDEEYDAELASSALKNSWDDEIEEDAFADSWENALDEAKPAQPTHKRVSLKQKSRKRNTRNDSISMQRPWLPSKKTMPPNASD